MNLNPLYELKERLESCMIAGLSLLSGDFRLVRAVEQMEPLSKASPVFQKIYTSAKTLCGTCENPADVLLDTLALVDAVLATQAAVGTAGEIRPLTVSDGAAGMGGTYSNAPYSQLAPLIEALTTSGSGHYSQVVDTYERNPEIFSDYRLRSYLVKGLNAGYAELAERLEEWLGQMDASFLSLLKQGFDPKGKKEMVRRIHVVEAIAGASENDWYLSLLDQAQKEVRVAAVLALRHSQENYEILQELVKTERGNGKKAALWALARMEGTDNTEFWEKQLKEKPGEAAEYLAFIQSDAISDLIADAVCEAFEGLGRQGNGYLVTEKEQKKLESLFHAMLGKASDKIQDIYRMFQPYHKEIWETLSSDVIGAGQRDMQKGLLEQMQDEKGEIAFVLSQPYEHAPKPPYFAKLLTDSMVWSMDKRLFGLAWELYGAYGERFLMPALTASLLDGTAARSYEEFSKYLLPGGGCKEGNGQQKQVRLEVADIFAKIYWDKKERRYVYAEHFLDGFQGKMVTVQRPLGEALDVRWIELLTHPKLKKEGVFQVAQNYGYNMDWDAMLANLICPEDPGICQQLGKYFHRRADLSQQYRRYFTLMKECGYQMGRGLVLKILRGKKSFRFWEVQEIIELAPMRLADKLADLEEAGALAESGKVKAIAWDKDRYERLHTEIAKQLADETKGI